MPLENHQRIVGARDTKANIEAFTGALEEQAFAYATDTNELGIYTNGSWVWDASAGGSSVDHIHGLARWTADGSAATFDLPDLAEYIEAVYDDGSLIDPATATLSSDRSQITLDSAPAAASIIVAQYVIARL